MSSEQFLTVTPLARPRLLRILYAAPRGQHVIVTAPSGYGKTTLLRAFAREQPHTHFFTLTPADADLAYLQARLGALVTQPHVTIILDDAHYLNEAPETLDWLASLLDDAAAYFIIGGRSLALPPTKNALRYLTADDLAFTAEESRAWGISEQWHAATRGWALALVLARRTPRALAAAKTADTESARGELFALLSRLVFNNLPAELLGFIQRTAAPRAFNLELAAHLDDTDAPTAQAKLAEVERRALFIETADPFGTLGTSRDGWYRYHDLVRAFLIQQQKDAPAQFARVVRWFHARGDWEIAIEHALEGGLPGEAARLLNELPPAFIWSGNRYRTFWRWVNALPDETREANPELLLRLGRDLHYIGKVDEGWRYLEQARALIEKQAARDGERARLHRARLVIATAQRRDGEPDAALQTYQEILREPTIEPELRMRTLLGMGGTLDSMTRLREARRVCEEALALAEQLNDEQQQFLIRINLATVLNSLGDFENARALLEANDVYCAERPGLRITNLTYWCELDYEQGAWDALQTHLQAADALMHQVEDAGHTEIWLEYVRVLYATGTGDLEVAQAILERAKPYSYEQRLYHSYYRIWLLRRQRQYAQAIALADELLAQEIKARRIRALTALEREIAALHITADARDIPELQAPLELVGALFLRADMVRVRALLALRCYRADDPRWQRHVRAALRALERPAYTNLLTLRDPDLGAEFWSVLLRENIAPDETRRAFLTLGAVEPLARLLDDASPAARARAVDVLKQLGREDALPHLDRALERERDAHVQRALEAARAHLETLPPPLLHAQLLGEFRVTRAGVALTEAEWHRPIVQRLFQYFALHRNEPLARDQILDDLWRESDPQNAAVTFRTVFSRLRAALEPHLRPKAPSRYFAVEGDVYRFDPFDRVSVDAEHFTQTVRRVLKDAAQHDVPPLPQEFVTALSEYHPLLPHLPLEEWLLEPRERLNALYVEGCLYVAQAQLTYNRLADALDWANKTIATASWSEEAYQVLMRAHARQGNRTLAFKAYNDAVIALQRELDLEPSPLTEWLAQQLRAGEEI